MRTYSLECYSPAIERQAVERAGERAIAATSDLRYTGVEYLGALLFPSDEVVFHLFAAEAERSVVDAGLAAGIEFERVSESIPVGLPALGRQPRPEEPVA